MRGIRGVLAYLTRGLSVAALFFVLLALVPLPSAVGKTKLKESIKSPSDAAALADVSFAGFVDITSTKSLYVDWLKAQPGRPTVVLLNGLTYDTDSWEMFTKYLGKRGIGVLRYDPTGMGRTMIKEGPYKDTIPIASQAEELRALILTLGITEKVNVVGLSYGGGLSIYFAGTYPEMVDQVFSMAPYTEALASQDSMIRYQIAQKRRMDSLMGIESPKSDEDLYSEYLYLNVITTYPSSEPSVLKHPYKLDATFYMVQGIRKWMASSVVGNLPANSLNLIIAGSDQYIDRAVLTRFWDSVPVAAQSSKMVLLLSEHKIPEAWPDFAAGWIDQVLTNKSTVIQKDKAFVGYPITGYIYSSDSKVKIESRVF